MTLSGFVAARPVSRCRLEAVGRQPVGQRQQMAVVGVGDARTDVFPVVMVAQHGINHDLQARLRFDGLADPATQRLRLFRAAEIAGEDSPKPAQRTARSQVA